jgi:cyanate lyase
MREERCMMLTHEEVTEQILEAKQQRGLSFEKMAQSVGGHPVWMAAVVYGQASMLPEQAATLALLLGLSPQVADVLHTCPLKGSLERAVPTDPLLYRFHEITQIYGMAMKAIIHEKFGDGIMSAIDFELDIQKKSDPKGDRVVVTYDGKFLPYRRW